MRSFPHSSYHLIEDLDIKFHNYIPTWIILNGKCYEGMVLGSTRTFKQRSDLVWVRKDFP